MNPLNTKERQEPHFIGCAAAADGKAHNRATSEKTGGGNKLAAAHD